MDIKDKFAKARLTALKIRKALTDDEVQELRDRAKAYRDSGGKYLEICESNDLVKRDK